MWQSGAALHDIWSPECRDATAGPQDYALNVAIPVAETTLVVRYLAAAFPWEHY
jgi:hypothetical protein